MLKTERRSTVERSSKVADSLPVRPFSVEEDSAPRPARAGGIFTDRLPLRSVITLGVAWPILVAIAIALEPAPANPDVEVSFIGNVLIMSFMFAFLAGAVGLAHRMRWAALASLVAAIAIVGGTVECITSGHHTQIGMWWFGQLVISGTLTALSWRALRARDVSAP